MTRQGQLAPGVVQVRLSGLPADAGALAAVLASCPAVRILTGTDGPYPSRRQPGHRLYLTLRLTQLPAPKPEPPEQKEPLMNTEPEAADPDAPIPCTLTPKAAAYLDALGAEPSPAEPEPEASR